MGAIEHHGINGEGLTYTHSSLPAFISKVRCTLKYLIGEDTQSALLLQLWNLDGGKPLTSRVAWASSFEHIITNTFRVDTPLVLPNPAAD